MRYYILQKLWHEYLGTKASDIKQDACHGNLSLRSCYFCWRARGYALSQTLFRFRRSFANAFFNKTHQLGRLIRYLPNFHDTPCLPPPSPANFFFFFHKHYPQFQFKSYAKCLACTRCNMEDVHMECELSLTAFAPTNLS